MAKIKGKYIEDGTIDETKLDVSTNASLDLADSSVQPNDDAVLNSVSITAGQKVNFEGSGGDTYFIYNSSTSKVELFVNGSKKADWG